MSGQAVTSIRAVAEDVGDDDPFRVEIDPRFGEDRPIRVDLWEEVPLILDEEDGSVGSQVWLSIEEARRLRDQVGARLVDLGFATGTIRAEVVGDEQR